MKYWIWILLALCLTGCAPIMTKQPAQPKDTDSQIVQAADEVTTPLPGVTLKDYGPAPEWQNEVWLNTEAPLHLADLRGQVVLLEMWTFG